MFPTDCECAEDGRFFLRATMNRNFSSFRSLRGKFKFLREGRIGTAELACELPIAGILNDLDHKLIPADFEQQGIFRKLSQLHRPFATMRGEQFTVKKYFATIVTTVIERQYWQIRFSEQIV